ncbi:hypothetical protein OCHUTO_0516 [Orientia chuto str. Dubai]|uniref:Uncharacterized protein n=1 Tax=Orientia chuto str. Dubai TaxID=1359168 RepID=A0A0F3MKK1_9RICK|nr:hypothetical protein OCHUTO_0516 [Orientia chuto str. Dubai]
MHKNNTQTQLKQHSKISNKENLSKALKQNILRRKKPKYTQPLVNK